MLVKIRIFILLMFSICLISCSGTNQLSLMEIGKCPNEIFYNPDSNLVQSKFIYYDKKFSYFTINEDMICFHSIRTDLNLENSTLYTVIGGKLNADTLIKKHLQIDIDTNLINELTEKYSIDMAEYLLPNIDLVLRANNLNEYLYYASVPIPNNKNKTIELTLQIFAITNKTNQILRIIIYLCGDKSE